MQGDVVIQMPTDLRTIAPFETETEFRLRQRKGITALTVDIPSSNHRARSNDTRPPSRWKTPEFALYYAVFLTAVPIMVWVPVVLSSSA
jgi:protein-cysteine N-palmitoyltransferase HHAT